MIVESLPIIVALCIAVLLLALLSVINIVFSHTEHYRNALVDQRIRYIAEKIEAQLKNRSLLTMLISIAKSTYAAIITLLVFALLKRITPWEPTISFLVTIPTTALLMAFPGYVLPHVLASRYSESLIPFAYSFFWIHKVLFFPVVQLMLSFQNLLLKITGYDDKLCFLTLEERGKLTGKSTNSTSLDQEERNMIRNIFEFAETTAQEIMVPRIDVVALPLSADFQFVLEHVSKHGHSRIPVYEENIDSIIGILYVKDILRWFSEEQDHTQWNLQTLIKKPHFVPANKRLDDLMQDMKKHHIHLAVVVDEYGGTAGIVAMEDMLEEIVGEIQDEYDAEESPVRQISEGLYLVNPHIELDDFAEHIPLHFDYEQKEYNTLGGLFYHEYGGVPETGTEYQFAGLSMKINKMVHQRIEEILITLPKDSSATEIDNSF